MSQYIVCTNEKYKLFLYLSVENWPKVYKSLYFTSLLISQEEKYKLAYTSRPTYQVPYRHTYVPSLTKMTAARRLYMHNKLLRAYSYHTDEFFLEINSNGIGWFVHHHA